MSMTASHLPAPVSLFDWHEILETCEKLSYYHSFSDQYTIIQGATVTLVAQEIGSRDRAEKMVDAMIETARKKHPDFKP